MSVRPVYRVASAGLDPRDVRLVEIVFQHSQYNRYEFRLLEVLNLTRTDILLANPVDRVGLEALMVVGTFPRRIPSVNAVPRGAQATARYSIAIDRLTLQLLPILNRVVEAEMLEPVGGGSIQPLDDELTDIHTDEAIAAQPVIAACGAAAPAERPNRVAATTTSVNMAAANPAARTPTAGNPAAANPAAANPAARSQAARNPAAKNSAAADSAAARSLAPKAAPNVALNAAVSDPASSGAAEFDAPRADLLWTYQPLTGRIEQAPRRARLQALIVDPSAAAQEQLARALRRIGLEVRCVASAAAALVCLDEAHMDLVVTESALIDTDGFDLIRRMRSRTSYRYTPVLLLRSRRQLLDATRARMAGDVTVLTKPLTRGELDSVVRQCLRNSAILDDLNDLLLPV